jgi:hypothetical protein
VSTKPKTVRGGLEAVKRDFGLAKYHLLRRCVAGCAELGTPDLAALADAFDRGIVPALMRGSSPAGSVGETFDTLADTFGPVRLQDALIVAEALQHLDPTGLAVVRAVAEAELARAQSPNAGGVN